MIIRRANGSMSLMVCKFLQCSNMNSRTTGLYSHSSFSHTLKVVNEHTAVNKFSEVLRHNIYFFKSQPEISEIFSTAYL